MKTLKRHIWQTPFVRKSNQLLHYLILSNLNLKIKMQHGYQFKNSKIKSQTNKLYMHLVAVKCITCDAALSHKYWKNIAH